VNKNTRILDLLHSLGPLKTFPINTLLTLTDLYSFQEVEILVLTTSLIFPEICFDE